MMKQAPMCVPTLFFRDGILSMPGYTFDKASPWHDTGGMTTLAEGSSLKDSSSVLAKIAPAQSAGSMFLEREAHILGKMGSSTDGDNTTLRMIEFCNIAREYGDCVVLLLVHPGINILGRYLPPSKVNDLLLADVTRSELAASHGDVSMVDNEDSQMEAFDIMDLATFLEFAIQATRCLEALHKAGIVHREVRANAFHLNSHSGFVRLVHFGNRAISLENFGSPSSLVYRAYGSEEPKTKEALCYLAPEQTGSTETMAQDHRTDLYSLGILFWTLLVGRGQMPFEGGALELLHSIVQKRPMPVHEVRRDVPQVLADIVDKLLSKNPDMRYQSAHGLKTDLIECQRRLLAMVSSSSEDSSELIPSFEIALEDRFMEFTIPIALFGRDEELDLIRSVIQSASINFSGYYSAPKGCNASPIGVTYSSSEGQSRSSYSQTSETAAHDNSDSMSLDTPLCSNDIRKTPLPYRSCSTRTKAVFVVGPPGIGKSSMILVNQAQWRSHGLWGQAKFQSVDSAPFEALLGCLSSVLRQLRVFHTDLNRFVTTLRERLGPQLQNVSLLYQGTPELKEVLADYGIHLNTPEVLLNTRELRARFQTLVANVFSVIAETRLFALFLDDLHEADPSTLDLVSTLLNSRSRMLIFATLRSDKVDVVKRFRDMLTTGTRPTWITLEPLSYQAISSLVSKTLHRPKEDCAPLSNFIFEASSGNAFSARSILTTLQRQHHITFHWGFNYWIYDMPSINGILLNRKVSDPIDLTYLISHMRGLPDEARKYLTWAAFFGETFKVTEVGFMMDWEDSSCNCGSEDEPGDMWNLPKAVSNLRDTGSNNTGSMRGLQLAIAEGWLITRARDMCSFSHGRYRQAAQTEAENLPKDVAARMSFRIILKRLHESPLDIYRIAEHAKHCLSLLHEHPERGAILDVLIDAGESAWACGAHELALQSFLNARALLQEDLWTEKATRTLHLLSRLAALFTWKGDLDSSSSILCECLLHCIEPEEQSNILRLRSRNEWLRGNFFEALNDTLMALRVLGIEISLSPTRRQAEAIFEKVKSEIMTLTWEEILLSPRTKDPKIELAVTLLNDAGMNAFWSPSPYFFADIIGLTTIQLALKSGMSPGMALGFFWALGERRELYRFSADLAKVALRIAERYGTSGEKCRTQVLFCSMVSGFDNVHIRANLPLLDQAIKYGNSSGDRMYTNLANIYSIVTRLYVCDHLSELVVSAEECVNDIKLSTPKAEPIILATAVLNCIRVLAGYTHAETVFNTENFIESEFLKQHEISGNISRSRNWYDSFKIVSYFSVGYIQEAVKLGFTVYKTRDLHPNHRHVRFALFFHSLAIIACIRSELVAAAERSAYFNQINANQNYLRKWLSPSPINASTWIALVDAELAALLGSPDAFKLYDMAIKLAVNNDWQLEEAWGLYLQGSHFERCGVEGLGSELQCRGISLHAQWGAQGIVHHLTFMSGARSRYPLKRPVFSSDVSVQTETVSISFHSPTRIESNKVGQLDDQESALTAADLAAILKWSKDISSDINLSAALKRLTEIATETSGSENTCVAITREAGDHIVSTSMIPPDPCQVHENPKSIRTINDPLQKAIIQYTLNSKERVFYVDASLDSRFSSEAGQTPLRSVVCLPIISNRGQTFGAVYVSSRYAFSPNVVTILTLLCQQASISISNSLLFRSVQTGTKENLKMIATQREALETARKSREDALKATKIKSNFLASMSHELRTPFSSFYGLLDLLSGTELNPGQSEIVQTAKQSCELLLKIIDSILDYSKLEASAVKLEPSGFMVENIIADCMELLLPMATKKLDLSFNIQPDVPPWVYADYARIRQVLMNLIGNAVKFTATGSVRVLCSVGAVPEESYKEDSLILKFEIADTGIGLSASEIDLLFVPFQQADNSSTRRFGGTGLGLSISRQLVKLMGGGIGVTSMPGRGSTFWFTIPLSVYNSEESKKSYEEIERMRLSLMNPVPIRALICSPSDSTLALLRTMLRGFVVISASSTHDALDSLGRYSSTHPRLDFVILDDQSEAHADDLARCISSMDVQAFQDTKVIHLYTPTTRDSGQTVFANSTISGVVKMTKPPREARLLQTLAGLKNLPNYISSNQASDVAKAMEDLAAAHRTLFGNILIAEDNPIAQNLLVKQLQRYHLNVTATGDGEEAILEWESHEPGYFSVALFDHHMPLCDGVEATKRLRNLEAKRKAQVILPIVALSADCQDSTKQLCLSAGMNAFFSKPLRKSDLISLMSMFGQTARSESGDDP